jgi:hypothetical protein
MNISINIMIQLQRNNKILFQFSRESFWTKKIYKGMPKIALGLGGKRGPGCSLSMRLISLMP